MATKYKLYAIDENGKEHREFYTKKELEKYQLPNEELNLFECAERMIFAFNRGVDEEEDKRYCYKLEKVSVQVLGSEPYYGLNVSEEMCRAEFY